MKGNKRLLALLCALALTVGLVPAAVAAQPVAELSAATHTVWFVGDSTVCNYGAEARYVPRNGYGQAFDSYLDSAAYAVNNQAVSGRSSQNFVSESASEYNAMKNGIKAGDYLIIGFGHNDEKTTEDRGTLPTVENWQTTDDSMGSYLYEYYIKVAQDAGATPILCTPIVRRTTGSYTGNSVHVTSDGDYPAAIKKVGADTNTPVIDLTTLTKNEWMAQTKDKNQYLHSWEASNKVDGTHLNAYGAKTVAWLLADAIKNSTDPQLADLAAALTPGTKPAAIADATDPAWTAMINNEVPEAPEGYQPCPNGEGKGEANKFKDVTFANSDVTFYGTMFGALGSADMSYYTAKATADSIQLAVSGDKGGKISSGADGFLMYYFPIPASATSYSLSATAEVTGLSANNQAGFGLMIRDDMYINDKRSSNDTPISTGYVAAGTLGNWQTNCFAKASDGKTMATNTGLAGKDYAVGSTIPLSVSFGGDNYIAQFGDEAPQTFDAGYSMSVVDKEYTYIGLFVSRTADVTFSDIVLVVDGEILCDTTPEEGELKFEVTDWKVEGGVLDSITTAKVGDASDAVGFAVVYSGGKMTGIKSVRIKPGKILVGLELKEGDTAKVFVLGKSDTAPLMECFVYPDPTAPAQ